MNRELKAFLIYAYAFIFLYMFNGLLKHLLLAKLQIPLTARVSVEALIMVLGLYFAYTKVVSHYFKVSDRRRLTVAWLWQFIPFFALYVLSNIFLNATLKIPNIVVFIHLNLTLVIIYFTFVFSLKKALGDK